MQKLLYSAWSRTKESIVKFFSTERFFVATLVLFAVQSVWIALSGIFPGAFDEDTHLSLIKFFASHPNPFFTHQPDYLNQFGPIVHNPSYLYHYVMSFPWRLITLVTDSSTAQIIVMRLLNVLLLGIGLFLIRKVLLSATSNRTLVHLAILLLVLTPIVPQLAAQINYDNLMIPLMFADLLLAIRLLRQLQKDRFNVWLAGLFLALGMLTSLVKYTFLPIFLAAIVYVLWRSVRSTRKNRLALWSSAKLGYRSLSIARRSALMVLVVISLGLFFERFGMNVIRYRTTTPDCVQVLGEPSCQQYSIYRRGIIYANHKPPNINPNPVRFTYLWFKHMDFNTVMAINGPASGYSIGRPLPLPYAALIVFEIAGALLCVVFWRKVFASAAARIFALGIALYLLSLWTHNYPNYLSTGRRVAVQGRYLVPLLPMAYLLFLLAGKQLLKQWPKLGIATATTLVACFMAGGGALTFILHSDTAWYWPNNSAVLHLNEDTQHLLRPVIPGSYYAPYRQSSLNF